MLDSDDIKVEIESQGFRCSHIGISPEKDKAVMFMESTARVDSVICPYCQQSVRMIENVHVRKAVFRRWSIKKNHAFPGWHLMPYSRSAPVNWKASTTRLKLLNVSDMATGTKTFSSPLSVIYPFRVPACTEIRDEPTKRPAAWNPFRSIAAGRLFCLSGAMLF